MSDEKHRDYLLELQRTLRGLVSPVRVLIVEDVQPDANLAAARLAEHGINCEVVSSGDAAIEKVSAGGSWLVFLDWKLIGLSGLETLAALKALPVNTMIIILTGVASEDDSVIALKHGAAAVMRKPLEDEQVKLIFGLPVT